MQPINKQTSHYVTALYRRHWFWRCILVPWYHFTIYVNLLFHYGLKQTVKCQQPYFLSIKWWYLMYPTAQVTSPSAASARHGWGTFPCGDSGGGFSTGSGFRSEGVVWSGLSAGRHLHKSGFEKTTHRSFSGFELFDDVSSFQRLSTTKL